MHTNRLNINYTRNLPINPAIITCIPNISNS
jgi:hypothetical protein